ncbi:hypothetical protein [Streptomyces sp. NPDC001492]
MRTKTRKARIALLIALGCAALAMVPFWGDPNTPVAIAAFTAWACLIIAMCKVR